MQLLKQTHQHQSALAAYCRTGTYTPIPGIRQENIGHYRRLVYSVVKEMLESAYPLTYHLLTEEEWENTVHDFFSNHSCQSPQVWYMPKEFYTYIAAQQPPLIITYPFLEELLLFEWMETALFMMEDKVFPEYRKGTVQRNKLVLNPEHELLSLHYPVHRKQAATITVTDKGHYFVAGHRHPNGKVIFTDLSPAFVKMLEYLAEAPATLRTLTEQFREEFQLSLSAEDHQAIGAFFENAYQQQLIIGFQ